MNITDKQYQLIINKITDNFEEYYNKYDFNKYSLDNYKFFQKKFSLLELENNFIEDALKWKWGHTQKSNYPSTHKNLVKEVEINWNQFVLKKFIKPQQTFEYWKSIFNRNSTYITTAYITHLVHFNETPIIDQHNYRAMNYLIQSINTNYKFKKKPSNWNDLINFQKFITSISLKMNIDKEKLDKYLMMYGKSIK